MHFVVALFHHADSDPELLMEPYSYEDDAYKTFELKYSKEEADRLFAKFKKENPDDDISLEDFMRDYYECYDEDEHGNFGDSSNPHGLYDWYAVGGRWDKILYGKVTEKHIKDAYIKDLNSYLEGGDRLSEYVRISNMPPKDYVVEKGTFGHTTIRLKDLDEKTTLAMNSKWNPNAKSLGDLFEHTIDEDQDGVGSGEDFKKLMAKWKKKDGYVTVIDCHT